MSRSKFQPLFRRSGAAGHQRLQPVFGDQPYAVGDRITIYYNPAQPDQVVHRRYIYKRSVRLVIALALLGFGALGAWYVVSRERVFRRLRRFDERRSG